ncbi:hypothetical protein MY10362_004170 [Beauveria mimosiformis]
MRDQGQIPDRRALEADWNTPDLVDLWVESEHLEATVTVAPDGDMAQGNDVTQDSEAPLGPQATTRDDILPTSRGSPSLVNAAVMDSLDRGLRARGLDWNVDIATHMRWSRLARDIRRVHPQITTEEAVKMAANNHRLTEMPTDAEMDHWATVCRVADPDW